MHHIRLESKEKVMQSYPLRALDRRLQENWARDAGKGPRVLMSLRVDLRHMGYKPPYLCTY